MSLDARHAEVFTAPASDLPAPRYEILSFGSIEKQVAELPEQVTLTVTTSPRHGVDRSLELALKLRELGHRVTLHLAARMVRDFGHAEDLLRRAGAAGIDDVFVIGGDAKEPAGTFDSALTLLDQLAHSDVRPARIGIGAYPEGHPLIADDVLDIALRAKVAHASYIVTQMCFDPEVIESWLTEMRAGGITLPVFIGMPGPIDRRKLVDISARIGVGQSLRFARKQRGLATLFRNPAEMASKLFDALGPRIGDPQLGIAGMHYFTFNELVTTWEWNRDRMSALGAASRHESATGRRGRRRR